MSVITGASEPVSGRWRIYWWASFALGVTGIVLALVSGNGDFAGSTFLLIYPLQRLFQSRPGIDPSRSGLERLRQRRSP
jgi:hypothetical protein